MHFTIVESDGMIAAKMQVRIKWVTLHISLSRRCCVTLTTWQEDVCIWSQSLMWDVGFPRDYLAWWLRSACAQNRQDQQAIDEMACGPQRRHGSNKQVQLPHISAVSPVAPCLASAKISINVPQAILYIAPLVALDLCLKCLKIVSARMTRVSSGRHY